MTGPGTNSYIVGDGPFAVIDPGVDDAAHIDALMAACDGQLAAVLLTHRHPDHAGGALALARRCSAPIWAAAKQTLGEHDTDVPVDDHLADGTRLSFGNVALTVLHTPGHAADHLCFLAEDSGVLFAGDSIMADVTVVILPPDGVMQDYMTTLDRLSALPVQRIAPGHGRLLDDPGATIAEIAKHRRARQAQVHHALSDDSWIAAEQIAAQLYPELDPRLRSMAAAQVTAHLISLADQGLAVHEHDGWQLAGG